MDFPYEIKSKVHGPVEAIGLGCGALVGAYLGWKAGIEAVNYVNQMHNLDVLGYMVKNHALATKFITLGIGAGIVGGVSRCGGNLVDRIIGTYYSDD